MHFKLYFKFILVEDKKSSSRLGPVIVANSSFGVPLTITRTEDIII